MAEKKKPAIRFRGFMGEWEERKLTDIVEFFTGLTYTSNDVQEFGTFVLRSSNVSDGEIVDADNVYVNPAVVNSDNVREGDIIIVVRNGSRSLIGKHAQIKRFMPHTVIGAFMTGIRSECSSFINVLLNTSHFEEEVAMNMGATINQITGYMFSKMEFTIPSLGEQKKIGEYFEKFNDLIGFHQRKYDKLQNVKKSMLEKMFPQNGSSVPEIRFRGFTEEWEERRFSEIFILLQNNSLSRADLNNEQGCVKNIHYGDVLIKFGEVLDAEKEEIPFVSNDEFIINRESLLQNGDIIIADAAEDETVGKCSEIKGIKDISVISGLHTIPCRPTKTFATGYLGYYINSNAYHNQLLPLIQGTKISSISKSVLLNTHIIYTNFDEQTKIGSFFTHLDHLITLHKHKLEKLQNIKKACLEKMFV